MLRHIQQLGLSLPIATTIRGYQKRWLRRDVIAGVTVAAIAVPQAMAYAQLAGAPLYMGLYAALAAMVVFALFSSSKQVIVGPDAAMAALTGATVIPLAHGNAHTAIALIALLSILIGLACLAGVVARIGFMAEFLSRPILLGYMAGLAISVIASQAPKLLGMQAPYSTSFVATCSYIATHLSSASRMTIGISLLLISAGMFFERYVRRIPSALALLVGATAASAIFGFSGMGVAIIGDIPKGLPLPSVPGVSLVNAQAIVIPALAIMLVSYANTVATARSFAARNHENVETDQEFLGLGAANIASGVFSGIPVSASGARTAVNHTASAKTQVSQLFGALAIAFVLVVLAPLLRYLPVCALAVIISMAVLRLFDYAELRSIWHAWRTEALLAIATVLGVTLLGVLQGLLLAVLLAVANLIRQSALPYDAVLGVAADGSVHDMDRPPQTEAIPGLLMYRFDAPLYFANASFFRERVMHLIDIADEPVKWFLWDAETITSIDSTAGKMLVDVIADLRRRHITFAIARMKGSVREIASKSTHLSKEFEAAPHYSSLGRAIESFKMVQRTHSVTAPKEKVIVSRTAAKAGQIYGEPYCPQITCSMLRF
jgi:SulP family sulfate permease